jgi:pilin isopeptide linkage protein
MMKRMSRILLAAVLVLAMALPVTALAAEHAAQQPDYGKTGSVTVDIVTATGETVAGGSLTAYRVADAVQEDGNNIFVLTEEFAGCNQSLDTLEEDGDPKLAAALAAYAEDNNLKGTTVTVDDNGRAVFPDLTLGLYLVLQSVPAAEYEPIRPFVVTVPMWDGEQLVYDVQANPKPGTAVGLAKYNPPMEKLVKVINGKAPADSLFVFRMTPDKPEYPMPVNEDATYDAVSGSLTITRKGPGSYEFGWMHFGLADVGKTYTYKLYEVAGDEANYKYDTQVYNLTIKVTQDAETEEVLLDIVYTDPDGRAVDAVKFINEYEEEVPPPPLPHTGQLWWPVPVLAFAGLALFGFGWMRRRRDSAK